MGLVHLPSLNDYWSMDPHMPHHKFMKGLNMTYTRVLFLWHNIHFYEEEDMGAQSVEREDAEVESTENDGFVELDLEQD
eukprot:4167179-Ditylum_brightwellii.AAC.1